jgi:hypothetical protein
MQHLKDLKRKFSNWRANKLTLAEPVPNKLWQEVKQALEHIRPGLLCSELGITQYQMRLYCGFVRKQLEPCYGDKFIEITPENKKTTLSQINKIAIPELTELEKHEILFVINNHPITLKLSANNLLTVLRDLKEVL